MTTTTTAKPAVQLYDGRTGVPKKEGDPPLGIGYDEDGIPHPDWEVVVEEGALAPDGKGKRRGARIVGALNLKDFASRVTRRSPAWGKKFGSTIVEGVGEVGAYGLEEAKLCLTTETFGWDLGADASLAPYPPYVRLCYGELRGEQDSIRLFVGLSEIHLLKDLDLREVHYLLHGLGYVCYNSADFLDEDRWWGPRINACPHKVSAGLPGGKGPMFYSWYYRLPPWMPGLVLEGEDGDYVNGPLALKLKANPRFEHRDMHRQKDAEDKMAALKLAALDQREDWEDAVKLTAPDYDEEKE